MFSFGGKIALLSSWQLCIVYLHVMHVAFQLLNLTILYSRMRQWLALLAPSVQEDTPPYPGSHMVIRHAIEEVQ